MHCTACRSCMLPACTLLPPLSPAPSLLPLCRPDRQRWRPFPALSGGQQALATLALCFALQVGAQALCGCCLRLPAAKLRCAPEKLHRSHQTAAAPESGPPANVSSPVHSAQPLICGCFRVPAGRLPVPVLLLRRNRRKVCLQVSMRLFCQRPATAHLAGARNSSRSHPLSARMPHLPASPIIVLAICPQPGYRERGTGGRVHCRAAVLRGAVHRGIPQTAGEA